VKQLFFLFIKTEYYFYKNVSRETFNKLKNRNYNRNNTSKHNCRNHRRNSCGNYTNRKK